MSDIGFDGIAAALAGLAMLCAAVVGLLAAALIVRRRRAAGRAWGGVVLGPALYGLLGTLMLAAAEEGSLSVKELVDRFALPVVLFGIVLWVFAHRSTGRPPVRPAGGTGEAA